MCETDASLFSRFLFRMFERSFKPAYKLWESEYFYFIKI